MQSMFGYQFGISPLCYHCVFSSPDVAGLPVFSSLACALVDILKVEMASS